MININLFSEYCRQLQNEYKDNSINIFLANNEDHILYSTTDNSAELSILSTMFSDSIYIIRINLSKVEDKNPLEVILETDKTVMLIYNIENHFILGITSRRDKVGMARNIATKALKHVSDQLKNVIAWIDSYVQ